MPDAKSIINQGLGKIGSSRISSITPPKTVLEGLAAAGWTQWKESELRQRRWVFAMDTTRLTPTGLSPLANVERRYQFAIPANCLRPLRPYRCPWEIRGQFFYSASNYIDLEFISRKNDNELTDVSFLDVLAWRVAKELVEPATQSDSKTLKAENGYAQAVAIARSLNAFLLEPQWTDAPDEQFSWVDSRFRQDA